MVLNNVDNQQLDVARKMCHSAEVQKVVDGDKGDNCNKYFPSETDGNCNNMVLVKTHPNGIRTWQRCRNTTKKGRCSNVSLVKRNIRWCPLEQDTTRILPPPKTRKLSPTSSPKRNRVVTFKASPTSPSTSSMRQNRGEVDPLTGIPFGMKFNPPTHTPRPPPNTPKPGSSGLTPARPYSPQTAKQRLDRWTYTNPDTGLPLPRNQRHISLDPRLQAKLDEVDREDAKHSAAAPPHHLGGLKIRKLRKSRKGKSRKH